MRDRILCSEKNFQREWFPNIPKLPYSHNWTPSNSRQFMDMLAVKYSLRNPGDWKKITVALVSQNGGNVRIR